MPGQDRDHRHDQDTQDHAAHDAAIFEPDDDGKAQNRHHDRPARHLAVGDQGRRIADDDTGILEGDQREEEADAGGNRHLERPRDRIDDPFADRRHADDEEEDQDEDAKNKIIVIQRHLEIPQTCSECHLEKIIIAYDFRCANDDLCAECVNMDCMSVYERKGLWS